MKEFLLNFDQGILLILKCKIGKDGIVKEELIREWSENVTDSAVMGGLVKELYDQKCSQQCVGKLACWVRLKR